MVGHCLSSLTSLPHSFTPHTEMQKVFKVVQAYRCFRLYPPSLWKRHAWIFTGKLMRLLINCFQRIPTQCSLFFHHLVKMYTNWHFLTLRATGLIPFRLFFSEGIAFSHHALLGVSSLCPDHAGQKKMPADTQAWVWMIVCQSVLALWGTADLSSFLLQPTKHHQPSHKIKNLNKKQVGVTSEGTEAAPVLQGCTTRWHKIAQKSEVVAC